MYMYKLDNAITFNQECNVKAILKKKKKRFQPMLSLE